jgi:Ca-activated chloride channel family protein
MPRIARVVPVVLLAAAFSLTVVAQQQPPFRSGANTVAVYTTVTDSEGRLATELTRDDFEIYDNGKLQPLTLFASEIQPITVVMMLDRSGSMKMNAKLVEYAAEAFIGKLMDADKARIGSFAVSIQVDPEEFTADRLQLVRIIRSQLQPPDGPTPLWNAVNVAMRELQQQEGRRVVLVFTDGMDEPMNFKGRNVSLMDVIDRATREDVMVYAIGLEGLMPGGGGNRVPLPNERFGSIYRGPTTQRPDPGLEKIAKETGGGYFELDKTEGLAGTFARVADELHRQYALGFEPTKLDGKAHKLEVKVKRSGMKVRARRSYIATRPERSGA